MFLSDYDISVLIERARQGCPDGLLVDPFDESHLGPASLDVTLSGTFRIFPVGHGIIDVREDSAKVTEELKWNPELPFHLEPGHFVLGSTIEYFEIPNNIVAQIEGRSSLGRLGLVVHSTAGFVDPGFKGTLTLELGNMTNKPVMLNVGMRVAQVWFARLLHPAMVPYGRRGKYQGQRGPIPSKIHEDFPSGKVLSEESRGSQDSEGS